MAMMCIADNVRSPKILGMSTQELSEKWVYCYTVIVATNAMAQIETGAWKVIGTQIALTHCGNVEIRLCLTVVKPRCTYVACNLNSTEM